MSRSRPRLRSWLRLVLSLVAGGGSGFLVTLPAHGNGAAPATHEVLVVVGAAGEPEFAQGFAAAVQAWEEASRRAGARLTVIGRPETAPAPAVIDDAADTPPAAPGTTIPSEPRKAGAGADDRDHILRWIADARSGGAVAASNHPDTAHGHNATPGAPAPAPASGTDDAPAATDASVPVWIVYLGHGSFDGREAFLNLRGPDLAASTLAADIRGWARPLVFVHGGSASAPFLPALAGPGRVLISATQSGDEINYARFGERFAQAVAAPAADLDQDGQTTVLEAFVTAARAVAQFYEEGGRMLTEHALLDDNGDGRGTPASWFRGVRATQRPATTGAETPAIDGALAHRLAFVLPAEERALTPEQRQRRDQLERDLAALREKRDHLAESVYLAALERLLRQLGALYAPPRTD